MVNLLPKKESQALFRSYYLRLGVVFLALVSGALFVGTALLIPSYVVSDRAADSSERYFAALEETVGIRERTGVTDDVRALAERIRILNQHTNEVAYAPFFEDALSDLSSGVTITGIAFTKGEGALSVALSGVAQTRGALLAFADTLRATGRFEGVTVPVSQFAQEADIPFSIQATYKTP